MNGLVHVYCGDGKGKTSAAIGLAVRAAGAGMQVLFVQFLKSHGSSELKILDQIANIKLMNVKSSEKFTFQMNPAEKAELKSAQLLALAEIKSVITTGKYDVLVLDEAINCVSTATLLDETLTDFVTSKPKKLELILTGRNPSQMLLSLADYVSEIKAIKHPYTHGISARKGIEF